MVIWSSRSPCSWLASISLAWASMKGFRRAVCGGITSSSSGSSSPSSDSESTAGSSLESSSPKGEGRPLPFVAFFTLTSDGRRLRVWPLGPGTPLCIEAEENPCPDRNVGREEDAWPFVEPCWDELDEGTSAPPDGDSGKNCSNISCTLLSCSLGS